MPMSSPLCPTAARSGGPFAIALQGLLPELKQMADLQLAFFR